MPKSRYYQHRAGRHSLARFVLLAVLLCGTGFAGYKKYSGSLTWGFNPQKLVADSVLSGKTFETEVREVVSPRAKIKAYLFEDRTNPIISVSFLFKNAGLANDAESEVGISGMAASLLTTGAGDMDRLQFSEELEDRAASIGFSAGRDDFSGALLTTKAEASRAYELLSMVLTQPRFAPEDIAQAKAERLLLLKQQQERPERVLALAAGKALFGTHPYGRNPLGEAGDIAAVTREKLLEYVRNHLVRSNLIVGIAGDITPEEAGAMLDEVFGSLPESGRSAFVRTAEVDFASGDKNIARVLPQSIAQFAAPGVARNNGDFYPLYVANHILGGSGLTSRLSLAAREDEALTYGVYSYMSTAEKAPLLLGGFSATPENFSRVKEIVREEWRKMGEKGVTPEEFNAAKEYLLASYNLRFASIGDIADILTAMQKEELGIDFLQKRNDYIRNIKLQEVNNAARKYFGNGKLRFITIGNEGAGKE